MEEGIPFLGFVICSDRRCLKRRKGIWYRRRLRGLAAAYQFGEIPMERLTASVRGWTNHARYGNTVGLRKAVLGETFTKKVASVVRRLGRAERNPTPQIQRNAISKG
ncbi:MAG: hypothetical protein K8R75_08020 [Deltaproteobacteria bacterium]|nr:hypothetical protein [Deltaproteobacteria bacterium]